MKINFFIKKFKKFKKWIKIEDNKFLIIASFFLLMQFFVIFGNYMSERYDVFFWFCNHTPLFFAFAFFTKNKNLIKGFINVGFLGQFVWTIDFLSRIFLGYNLFNMTNYVFDNPNGLWVLLPIGIHIFSTNLALYFTYKKKPNIYSAFYSLLYITFLYAGTITYTLTSRNVNCIFEICGFQELTFSNYTNFWPILTFFLVAIPTQGIQYFLYKLSRRPKTNK